MRQTVTYLKQRFAEVGLTLQSRHGQNFLIDLNLLRLLAETADVQPNDVVLEVGTGSGALTAMLARQAAAVVTVEIDPRLHQIAYEELIDFDNVTMLQQDALAGKNRLDPRVMDAVREKLAAAPDRRFKLVANLPYSVATPVISNLLDLDDAPVSMTITIQKELAERIVAGPSTKDRGALSIWVQSQCRAELVRLMPPEAFWPRPKVTSAIVQIVLDPQRRERIADREFFHTFVRRLFLHRRKFLRSVLPSVFKGQLEKSDADAILGELTIPTATRAEQLDVPMVLQLAEAVQESLKENGFLTFSGIRRNSEHATTPLNLANSASDEVTTLDRHRVADYRGERKQGIHKSAIAQGAFMKFIEMSGGELMEILNADEVTPEQLQATGLTQRCLVRINLQGDIEVRRRDRWDVIGGLLGDFDHRIRKATGREWA